MEHWEAYGRSGGATRLATTELFINGTSAGAKTRRSQDFPAAGLRWLARFREGANHMKVVARRARIEVEDEITLVYETRKWGPPARLDLRLIARDGATATIEARLFDAAGLQCLDARNRVRFQVAGDARLLDNLGTVTGSRVVEVCNGRAAIRLEQTGRVVACVTSAGLPAAFVQLNP